MARYSLSFVLFFLLSVPAFAAKIPMTLEEVPIYPDGIVMPDEWVQAFKKGGMYRMQEELNGLILKDRSFKVYGVKTDSDDVRTVRAVFEELKKFYWGKIGGKGSDALKLPDYSKLKPGTATNVKFGYDFGAYVFFWIKREANNDITLFSIYIANAGFKNFPGKIMAQISADTYSKNVTIKTPGEAELGAPVYPGAVYAPKESVTSNIMATHVFYSSDPAEKVVQFYERQTGIAPLIGNPTSGGKSYMFQGYSKKNRDNWIAVIDNEENSQGKIQIEFVLAQ